MKSSYYKLRSGKWGARLVGADAASAAPGRAVRIFRRDGTADTRRIERVIWRGDGVVLVALARQRQSEKKKCACTICCYRWRVPADEPVEVCPQCGGDCVDSD